MPDRKTFLFFNCLLDGMHTKINFSRGFLMSKCADYMLPLH
ncbi:hypothetical protein GCWU000342_01074 [Shuttleworthella satelles DSM 14600]|uniref:Uncharacterized protein n=1 Tax=Shuttleworthella satelles DSM 14600 TaxID=626523 RepID=C4GAX3_9FIRM|nr:hypothetical protein GCWU000342_01074 [Shuttleworthia satelles DSM 14600]